MYRKERTCFQKWKTVMNINSASDKKNSGILFRKVKENKALITVVLLLDVKIKVVCE